MDRQPGFRSSDTSRVYIPGYIVFEVSEAVYVFMGQTISISDVWRAVNRQPGVRSSDMSRRDLYSLIFTLGVV